MPCEGGSRGKIGESLLVVHGRICGGHVGVHDSLTIVVVGAAPALGSLSWLRYVSVGTLPGSCARVVPLALPHFLLSCHQGGLHHRVCHQASCLDRLVLRGGHSP